MEQREWKLLHLGKIVIKNVKEEKDKPVLVVQGKRATTKGRKAVPLQNLLSAIPDLLDSHDITEKRT